VSAPRPDRARPHSARDLAAPDVASIRAGKPHTSMFVRMLVRAAILRRGRAATALVAMIVAAAVTTALLNLYVDVQAKLQHEFRNYGANITLTSKQAAGDNATASLPADVLARVDAVLAGRGIAAPFGMIVARTIVPGNNDGQPVVVVGADFDRVRQIDKWWSVGRPADFPTTGASATEMGHPAWIGVRALAALSPNHQPFELTFQGRRLLVTPGATVQTGAAEDSRIYLSLADFENWTGVEPSTIEVAANGSPEEISAMMNQLERAIPSADVRPVRQIMEGEARVLGKTRTTLLASATLIILTASLCVLSTLMGWVFDRRRDFAIMKALGASARLLNGFFAAEAAALGATGAILGFALGIGIAAWIGRVNFHAPIVPRFSVLPLVLAGSMVVTLVAAILPISLLRRVEPAEILRGE
jgi:putative ABC transport system permease protein